MTSDSNDTSASRASLEPPAEAVALTAFRVPAGSETGRWYTATTFPKNPWQGCEHMIRMAHHVGFIKPSCTAGQNCQHYAVLDVLDDNGSIVRDYCIPHARAWRWWYRKLNLRVIPEPDGYTR